jgi:LPS export ABC transporter protein LptC
MRREEKPPTALQRTAKYTFFLIPLFSLSLLSACSFDYENADGSGEKGAVVIMREMEYVRVQEGNPAIRIRAEEARRYEERHTMELDEFSFERFDSAGSAENPAVSAQGKAGTALIELDTGNFAMDGGVSIQEHSEGISIETPDISWKNEERILSAPGEVQITRSDGSTLSGKGLTADMRRRSWEFAEAVKGSIIEESIAEEAPDEEPDER